MDCKYRNIACFPSNFRARRLDFSYILSPWAQKIKQNKILLIDIESDSCTPNKQKTV